MAIKLYVFPGGDGVPSVSPPCVRVQLALARTGREHETIYLRSRAEACKVSRTERLPAIDIDGTLYSDSMQILDELERRFPDPPLAPADPDARMRDRLWEHYINDHVYWLGYYMRWVDPVNHERFVTALFSKAPLIARMVAPTVLRRATRKRARLVGIAGKTQQEIVDSYEQCLELIDRGLGGGPFLEGRDAPGRGDLATASTVAQVGFRGTMPAVEQQARNHPAVIEHTARVFEACNLTVPNWLQS